MWGHWEIILVLVIVLIIFGPKNLPKLARSIGKSARELKDGLTGIGSDDDEEPQDRKPSHRAASSSEPRPDDPPVTDAQPVERNDQHAS